MGYYRAGGYYRGGGYYRAGGGLGSFLSGVGSAIGGALKTVGGIVGGVPGAVMRGAGSIIAPSKPTGIIPAVPSILPGGAMQVPTPTQTAHGVTALGVSPLGTVGVAFRKHRHMNPANTKAARRAIRRITSVRHLLKSIERQLPMRPAPRRTGSPGVITRAEAARALRS